MKLKEIFENLYSLKRWVGFVGATESIYNHKEFGLEKVSTFIYRKHKGEKYGRISIYGDVS